MAYLVDVRCLFSVLLTGILCHGLIVNPEKGSEIVYTVPEGVSGTYDIYLTVSKIMAQFT